MIKSLKIIIGLVITISIITFIYFKKSDSKNIIKDTENEIANWDRITASNITFKNDIIKFKGRGAKVKGNTITINKSGEYAISGNSANSQIIVDTKDKEMVKLIFKETSIKYEHGPPIYIKNAEEVVIILEKNTKNTLSDTENYILKGNTGTIYSNNKLTICGEGSLIISSNYQNALFSKNKLEILNGNIEINSVKDGIVSEQLIYIKNGKFNINSKNDAIKILNSKVENENIIIDNGEFMINAVQNGIITEQTLKINNGKFNINTGGGSNNNENYVNSEGIYAKTLIINSGNFKFNTSDNSIHSETFTLKEGTLEILSNNTAIYATKNININNGNIDIKKSNKGIESQIIKIYGGNLKISSNNEGLNILNSNETQKNYLSINDGYIYIDSNNNGINLDSFNYINGGNIIINSSLEDNNIKYIGKIKINNGIFVLAGNSSIEQILDTSSKQYILAINLNENNINNLIHIEDSKNKEILTFSPAKNSKHIIISTPNFKKHENYNIYLGGSYSNVGENGIYSNGVYTKGTILTTLKINNILNIFKTA